MGAPTPASAPRSGNLGKLTHQLRPVPTMEAERRPDTPEAPATHLSLKSRKTLASELPPAIMDTSMALRKL